MLIFCWSSFFLVFFQLCLYLILHYFRQQIHGKYYLQTCIIKTTCCSTLLLLPDCWSLFVLMSLLFCPVLLCLTLKDFFIALTLEICHLDFGFIDFHTLKIRVYCNIIREYPGLFHQCCDGVTSRTASSRDSKNKNSKKTDANVTKLDREKTPKSTWWQWKEETPFFNRKKPGRTRIREEQPSAATGWGWERCPQITSFHRNYSNLTVMLLSQKKPKLTSLINNIVLMYYKSRYKITLIHN